MKVDYSGRIFVFGSNTAGRHGKGAALVAFRQHGAIMGQGGGLQGMSYAIPTKGDRLQILPLSAIRQHVEVFCYVARSWASDFEFNVTAIGCGLAGYSPEIIAPLFEQAKNLENVFLPEEFCDILGTTRISFRRGQK